MKKTFNTLRWIYVGFILGATAMCYLISVGEETNKENSNAN